MIVSIFGRPKVGKTHFCFTAPPPIVSFDFDRGGSVVQTKFPDKDIMLLTYPVLIKWKGKLGESRPDFRVGDLWQRFAKEYQDTLKSACATIVLDTATQLWEIIRLAYFEKVQEDDAGRKRLQPIEYAEPNSVMRGIINSAKEYEKHLLLTHYVRDVYIAGERTEFKEADGFKYTPGLADVSLGFALTPTKPPRTEITIVECRYKRELNGELLPVDATWDDLVFLTQQ